MSIKKSKHPPCLKLIKGGKHAQRHYSNKSHYYYLRREKKRQQKLINYANACVDTLALMQQVAKVINNAFYVERLTPHYEVLRNTISKSENAEQYSTNIITRELCLYKSFAKNQPKHFGEHQCVLDKGEAEYIAFYSEHEETQLDQQTGLRFIAKNILLYVSTKDTSLHIKINQELVRFQDNSLIQLFYNMNIHIHF